jgi:uncharacterized repeat protein (TIGR03803 family)
MRRIGILVAGFALLSLSSAQANFRTLYSFKGGNDGSGSVAGLVMDRSGNLYGTTIFGGAQGLGIVFALAPDGNETVLHAFKGGNDGAHPAAELTLGNDGALYGTTTVGGGNGCGGNGCGTVFKVTTDGTETVLHAFNGADGAGPKWGVIQDGAGNIFGSTNYGAEAGCQLDQGCGVVFKLTPQGRESVRYTFQGGSDGGNPNSALIRDASGNLYGAALWGGNNGNDGVIFKLKRGGGEAVLQKFSSKALSPAGLSMDGAGNLYTTLQGGAHGRGAVYRLAPDGTGGIVYSFQGRKDGDTPFSGVIVDSAQNLYGTTIFGGGKGCGGIGCGTAFKIAPDGTETILHSFHAGHRGAVPSRLIIDKKGDLYGTTFDGGLHGAGTVFRLTQ